MYDVPVWQLTASQYQARQGVKQPYIAEISPMQYWYLSKRGKSNYDAQRTQEWQASSDCKNEWRDKVIAAYEAGEISWKPATEGLSDDARNVLIHYDIDKAEAAKRAETDRAHEANRFASLDEVEIGQRVYDVIYARYAVVLRKFGKSVRLETDGEAYTTKVVSSRGEVLRIQRLAFNDVAA